MSEAKKTKLPTIRIHNAEYVLVKDRVLFFNEAYPQGSIQTAITFEDDLARCRAVVTPDISNPARIFVGHSEARRGSPGIAGASPVEVVETSAVGRALAFLGIGIIESIASADEIVKATTAPLDPTAPRKECASCGETFSVQPGREWAKLCTNCFRQGKKITKKDQIEPPVTDENQPPF